MSSSILKARLMNNDDSSKSLDSIMGRSKAAEIKEIRERYETMEVQAPLLFSKLFPGCANLPALPCSNDEEAKNFIKANFSKFSKVGNMVGMYTKDSKLGTGSFSSVFKARCIVTGRRYAMKVIPFYRPSTNKTTTSSAYKGLEQCHLAILNEIYLQSYLQQWESRHTVQLYDVFRTNGSMILVQEYCEGGDLFHYVTANYGSFNRHAMVESLTHSIAFLHSQGVIHRDLKLENIFIVNIPDKGHHASAPCPFIKIGDFGLSKRINDQNMVSGSCGSREYMSPEIWLEPLYDGYLADVWALGILSYAIFNKYFPFETQKPVFWKQLCQGLLLPMRPNVPNSVRSVILNLLTTDVSQRPRMIDVEKAISRISLDENCGSSSDSDF